MTSERFRRALKELDDILARGKLAQDTTVEKALETERALLVRIYAIGVKEDGMTEDEVRSILDEHYVKPAEQEMEEMTLFDMLGGLLQGIDDPDELGGISNSKIPADLPHDKKYASVLFRRILDKFNACTESERRNIARSDAEFIHIVGNAIALRCGFKNVGEAFDIDESKLQIPKIKRGKELFWSEAGDPEPETTPEDQAFHSKISELVNEIVIKFGELYPQLYTKLKDQYDSGGRLVLNTSHKEEADTLHRLSKKPDLAEFRSVAIPTLVDALVMSFLTQKKFYVNNHKRKSIRKTLIESILLEKK